jgi:hypothetical protein
MLLQSLKVERNDADSGERRPLAPGPRCKTFLPSTDCARDLTMEMHLLKAARWNSLNGKAIFCGNQFSLSQVATWHVPGVSDPRQGFPHVLIGFIPALDADRMVHIPFLVLPSKPSVDTSLPVKSQFIQSFYLGKVAHFNMANLTKCPICPFKTPEFDLSRHLKTEHGVNTDVSVNLYYKEKRNKANVETPGIAELWTFSLLPDVEKGFPSGDKEPEFYFREVASCKNEEKKEETVKVKKEPQEADSQCFKCRFCPKVFRTITGWDSHVDAKHANLNSYLCPNEDCIFVSQTKMGLNYHTQFCCEAARKTPNQNVRVVDQYKSLLLAKPKTPATSLLRKENENVKQEVDEAGRTKTPEGSKTVKVEHPNDIVDVVDIKDNQAAPPITVKEESPSSKSLKRKRSETTDVATPETYASPHSNKAKRRQKHPQVSFTALLKEIVKNISAYITTSKVVLWKERKFSLQKQIFKLCDIEERVDNNDFSTVKDFSEAFEAQCQEVIEKFEETNVNVEVAKDLIQFCKGELLIKKDDLERLEKEINPLLSGDQAEMFKHVLTKILEEDVLTMKLSFHFKKAIQGDAIKNPIGLDDILAKARAGAYNNKRAYMNDFSLLYRNCLAQFGRHDSRTANAKKIFETAKEATIKYRVFF